MDKTDYIRPEIMELIYFPERRGSVSCGTDARENGDLVYTSDIIEMLNELTHNDQDMDNTQDAIQALINYLKD